MSKQPKLITAGGRISCDRCQAISKRTKQQCAAPASKGKTKCKFHGGASTGPRTTTGRQRCAAAKTLHGKETTAKRLERREASAQLAVLEMVGHKLGFMHGPRTRGRKPERIDEAYLELQMVFRELLKKKM